MVILLSNSKFYYIAQKNQLFLQWQFVSEIPCNPQTYGMRARKATVDHVSLVFLNTAIQ
jgi:hypothetical protein